jgi:hypothetical protein
MSRHQLVVLTKALPGREAEFEDWYDTQHVPDVLRVPGVVSARRLHVQQVTAPTEAPAWLSLAIYEIEGDDPEAVLTQIKSRARTPEMPLTEALDQTGTWQILAGPMASDKG